MKYFLLALALFASMGISFAEETTDSYFDANGLSATKSFTTKSVSRPLAFYDGKQVDGAVCGVNSPPEVRQLDKWLSNVQANPDAVLLVEAIQGKRSKMLQAIRKTDVLKTIDIEIVCIFPNAFPVTSFGEVKSSKVSVFVEGRRLDGELSMLTVVDSFNRFSYSFHTVSSKR